MMQNRELVIYRDTTGHFRLSPLEEKPADITVDHTYDDADFARIAIQLLEKGLTSIDDRQTQFLFVTGEDPAFVLVDLHGRLIVFINSPADPEEQEVPVWFAMKAINSLIVRSLGDHGHKESVHTRLSRVLAHWQFRRGGHFVRVRKY